MDPQTLIFYNHLIDPKLKNKAWAAGMMWQLYFYGGAKSLLDGVNVQDVEDYAAGKQAMSRYKKMFKRLGKTVNGAGIPDPNFNQPNYTNTNDLPMKDITGIDWEPLGIMVQPLNSALAVIMKSPIYVKCTAIDALAKDKRDADFDFMKNRPFLQGDLANFSKQIGSVITAPQVPNNSENVDINNFDLNPEQEDELNFFINMFYRLRPESAFECVLLALSYSLDLKMVRDLEARDQAKYGVSANHAFFSDITGLPAIKYIFPGDVWTPFSQLNDFKDQTHRYVNYDMTAADMMDTFGTEVDLTLIGSIFDSYFKDRGIGNTTWASMTDLQKRTQTIPVTWFEFKSWDAINFHKKQNPTTGYFINEMVAYDYELRYGNNFPDQTKRGKEKVATKEDFLNKKYIQNTYCGYWIPTFGATIFKYKLLEGACREPGRESLSPFGVNIWKSQSKGAVQLCMPIIDDVQKAYFKMQHTIVMAKPHGQFVDMRFLRNAVYNMKEADFKMTLTDLVTLLAENNIFLGDSEGIDPAEMLSGARPFYDIPGGVGSEISGYLEVINDGYEKIGKITGWNDALTGQSPNPDALVGVQKLMLQSGLNSLYYVQDALKNQTEKVFKMWAAQAQAILKAPSSASYKTLEAIVGSYKVKVINDLHEIPLHQFGIMVENAPTESEQANLNQILMEFLTSNRISALDYVTLVRIFNYKDAQQLLAIREKKQADKMAAVNAQGAQAALAPVQLKEQSKLQQTKMTTQTSIQNALIVSGTQKWLAQFAAQMNMKMEQLEGMIKTSMQDKRLQAGVEKATHMANLSAQKPILP